MRRSKVILWCSVVLMMCSAVVSHAERKGELTLLMVPREEETLRVGMDIANRFETMLVSYKLGANNAVSLHGWTGSQWVNITLDNFQKGDFFRQGPDTALVVRKDGVPMPAKMLPPADWCDSASMIMTTELRPLLHLAGQYFNFSYKDWKWFAKRYNMDMDAINPDQLNVAWYHRRMGEHLTPRDPQGASDLQYWVTIRRPVPLTQPGDTNAVMDQAEAESAEDAENLLTNEVPSAVIMGAGDADEEHAAETTGADAGNEAVKEEMPAETNPSPDTDADTAAEEKTPAPSGDMQ